LLGKDRVQSGERAIRDYGVDCLILDDGFQHLKLKRDLDIVVIDTLNSISDDFLIPRGTLRGPLKDLNRADLFILSHCDLCDDQTLKTIYTKLRYINADIPICETVHKPVHIENIKDNSIEKPEWLRGKRVYVLCAIGNPESFKSTLIGLGADVIGSKVYRDHHSYLQSDLDEVVAESESLDPDAIVVTQKDIVKIRSKDIGNANFVSLKIEMQITKGAEFYEGAIDRIMSTNDVN
jgi:tetraacyldisaccharide 4'-kinase